MKLYPSIALKSLAFNEILSILKQQEQNTLQNLVVGLSHIHKAHFAYSLKELLSSNSNYSEPILLITEDEQNARRLCDDINAMDKNLFLDDTNVTNDFAVMYPAKDFSFRNIDTVSKEYEHIRLGVLSKVLNNKCSIVVASIDAVCQHTIPKNRLEELTFSIISGEDYNLTTLVQDISSCGYVKRPQVEGIAQFSLRGGILDIYPSNSTAPIRIDFWGDTIDQMSYFDIATQRKTDTVDKIDIIPVVESMFSSTEELLEKLNELLKKTSSKKAKEVISRDITRVSSGIDLYSLDKYLPIAYPNPENLLNYFTNKDNNSLVIISEYANIKERMKAFLWQHHEDIKILLEEGELCGTLTNFTNDLPFLMAKLKHHPVLYFDTFAHSSNDIRYNNLITVNTMQNSKWSGDYKLLLEDLEPLTRQKYTTFILSGTTKSAVNLTEDLKKDNINAEYVTDITDFKEDKVYILSNTLSNGFVYPDSKVSLITLSKHTATAKKKDRFKKGKTLVSIADVDRGDAVVHITHGIGIFDGIHKVELQGITKDYLKINYAGSDILYIPVTQLDLISKYIGPKEDKSLKLNKLNNNEWTKTKQRVKKAVDEMADELIALYAKRAKEKGYSFSTDTVWQKEFEDHFEYEETDDQLRSVVEIKEDMEKTTPMERLLCGDVGFGKTEVFVRAAFKSAMDSKQCAILCPTTILAWQHFESIKKRIGNFPITVELLSRFRTPKQIKETIKKLSMGQVDIVIGTHRLIQKDVIFKDLGLAIIDEEQRFGVAHKEKFKESFTGVDMLSISATPIPRTLNMALTGIRDMSTLEEAPQDRHPVQSYVIEHDYSIIAEAIKKELNRDGQVYYIHNRIDTLESCKARLAEHIPEARIATAHGRLSEHELSTIWRQLLEKEIDVLMCTTIIETGVDVPNCNTLIIDDADHMGLSQLYQLRGRIGRSNRRAFAYFTFRKGKVLSEIATKRLSAIREFTKFGSGFNIAMRDLEIRGAGNVLGTSQHGHMEAVGYEMYLRLLNEAVADKKGDKKSISSFECTIDIKANAYIPEDYIEEIIQRIDIYKKIASIRNYEDSLDVTDELIDRFGEPPTAVKSLVDVALLKNTLAINGFSEIQQQVHTLLLYPSELNMEIASKIINGLPKRVSVNAGNKPYIAVKLNKSNDPVETLREVAATLVK